MRVTEYQTKVVYGSVWPRDGKGPHGPHNVRFGVKAQPDIVKNWPDKQPVSITIEQPNEDDNFTIIRVMFLKPGTPTPSFVKGVKFKKVRQYRNRGGGLEVRIKVRYTNSLPHPLPTGRYVGTSMYDDAGKFAVLTLQAGTLRKAPEPSKPKTIITPDDPEFHESLKRAKKTLS